MRVVGYIRVSTVGQVQDGQGFVRILQQQVFGDFKLQLLTRQTAQFQCPVNGRKQGACTKLLWRDID